jgi:hypothetical protein
MIIFKSPQSENKSQLTTGNNVRESMEEQDIESFGTTSRSISTSIPSVHQDASSQHT